jgi:hypothetical protein
VNLSGIVENNPVSELSVELELSLDSSKALIIIRVSNGANTCKEGFHDNKETDQRQDVLHEVIGDRYAFSLLILYDIVNAFEQASFLIVLRLLHIQFSEGNVVDNVLLDKRHVELLINHGGCEAYYGFASS